MKYTYTCKKVPLNDSIKEYAEKRLEKLEKYFHREDATAFVTFTVEKDKLCTVEITIRDARRSSGRRLRSRMGICGARLMPLSAILSVRF